MTQQKATVTIPLFHILQKSFRLNWTVLPVLDRGDEALQGWLSFPPLLFFFFFLQKKKKNPPSHRRCYFSCCCLVCDWSFIAHSALLPVSPAAPAFTPCSQTNSMVSPHLRNSHQGNRPSTDFNIHDTNRSLCCVLAASSIFSYLL